MSKVQKKVIELAKKIGGVTEWDLQMRGIPLTALKALERKGLVESDGVIYKPTSAA